MKYISGGKTSAKAGKATIIYQSRLMLDYLSIDKRRPPTHHHEKCCSQQGMIVARYIVVNTIRRVTDNNALYYEYISSS